ncbi:MAG TPA: amidohydrolase [Oligoflexus sp.]|uniref:amidohydrolase n=1 Tax=Oligoflexus sp. TaxID=1971216 RepID=UPI002D5B53FE|nr:amidohydrolase [Oligoflexus sp.]HYX37741.1 amidohydrolase [Oligoflexus sp.]
MNHIAVMAVAMILCSDLHGQTSTFYEDLKKDVAKNEVRMIDNFKRIHSDPELGYQEEKTAKMVADALKGSGYEVRTGIGKTGVVGLLKNGAGPVVMVRSDMDALPMSEQTRLPYASKKNVKGADGSETPVAHTCGHDAHTAWLMEIAHQMARTKENWAGTLIMVAQPAEELLSGATSMVKDGLYEFVPKPDVLISAHTSPTLPAGKVGIRNGRRLTGSTSLDVTIRGIGGHGSSPHLAKDPIVLGSLAVLEYQTLISRGVDPTEVAVLSVGAFQSGTSNNIIADQAVLKVNLRWFDEKVRDTLVNGIKSTTDHLALGQGLGKDKMPTYTMVGGTVPVVNDTEATAKAKKAMVKSLGEKNVLEGAETQMASEDFHLLAAPNPRAKIVWIEVGSGKPDVREVLSKGGSIGFNHNPAFQVELPALATAVTALSSVVLEFMPVSSAQPTH